MLTTEERTQVQKELASALGHTDSKSQRVRDIFPDPDEHNAILLRVESVEPWPLARIVLDECLLSRWTRTPAMLGTLLDYLIEIRGIGRFAPILERVSLGIDPNQSAYDDAWLLGNSRPFFDRGELRKKVRILIESDGRPILLVPQDGLGYGRSYSADYLAHLQHSRPDLRAISLEIKAGSGPSFTVEDLLDQASSALGSDRPLPPRDRSCYSEAAARWLLRPLANAGPRSVLLLDGFGQEGVAPEVRDTVMQLALEVTKAQYRDRVRLMLLDYPPKPPELALTRVLTDKLPGVRVADLQWEILPPPAVIGPGDLLPCLESWERLYREQGLPGVAALELAKLAQGLLARAPAEGKDRLAALHNDLLLLRDLLDVGDVPPPLTGELSEELTAERVLRYLDSQAPQPPQPGHLRAYRAAAAVLASIADLGDLRPAGLAPPGRAAELLGPDLVPTTGSAFHGGPMLRPEVRAEAIAGLIASGGIAAALDANTGQRIGPLQSNLERYLLGDAPPLAEQTLAELESTLQIAVWLGGTVDGVPAVAEVEARAGYFRLIAPFEALAGDTVFRGRRPELHQLSHYAGSTATERAGLPAMPAMSISGIGGAGKSSLVARFMLEHTRLPEERRIPFGYLDFARPSLDVGDPLGLCRELLRQLDQQFPALGLARGFPAEDAWPGIIGDRTPAETVETAFGLFADVLGTLETKLGSRPYIVVLDTFEEVQYRGEERAFPFWEMLSVLQNRAPWLRVIVAGRAPVTSLRLAGQPPAAIELGDLDDDAAAAFLHTQGIGDPELRRRFIDAFGRLPLSLKLAAALAARTPGGAAALVGSQADGVALVAASDEVIQARLYGRILDHIADERVRRIAHPGLTLRRINPELILNVLNEPCGLHISTIEEATALFDELRRETSLVSVDTADGDLVHRPDLRKVMLRMLLNGSATVVRQIHERALTWWARQRQSRENSRAEFMYHWLQLPGYERMDAFERTWLRDPEIRASIQAAIDEFPLDTQRWLATQGFRIPAPVLAKASRAQLHAAYAAEIEEELPFRGTSLAAAKVIYEREYASLDNDPDRGASPLFLARARVAAQGGDDEQARALIEEGLERAVRDGAPELTLGLLKEQAWLNRDRSPAAQADGLALLGDYARRQDDSSGWIQYQAQSLMIDQFPRSADAARLGDLIEEAEPLTTWHLMPVLGALVAKAPLHVGFAIDGYWLNLVEALRAAVRRRESPFQAAEFPDRRVQSALDGLLSAADSMVNTDPGRSDPAIDETRLYRFLDRVGDLCAIWPYRILYVAPPYGRRSRSS